MSSLRVCVIYGGWSSERDVSIASTWKVRPYLDELPHEFVEIELSQDRKWIQVTEHERKHVDPLRFLQDIDVALLLLHGVGGEDGVIQGFLETVGVPYTGPGVAASSIFMDKILTKHQFMALGINTPEYFTVTGAEAQDRAYLAQLWTEKAARWEQGLVVKPARGGSSFGVSVVDSEHDYVEAVNEASRYDDRILVERFITGVEVQVGLIGSSAAPETLPTLELVFNDGQSWFDPDTKYGSDRSRVSFRMPADVPNHATTYMRDVALKLYSHYGFEGYGRLDFLVPDSGLPLALEVNTITGMTPTSTFPLMAEKHGLAYGELINRLIELARSREEKVA